MLLTQKDYLNRPGFLKPLSGTVVHRMGRDHLDQAATLEPAPIRRGVIDWPVDSNLAHNTQILRECIPPEYRNEVTIGTKPKSVGKLGRPRITCDLCMSLSDVSIP